MPRRIFVLSVRGRTNRQLQKTKQKGLHNLCSSLGVIIMIKAEEIRSSCSRQEGGEKCVQSSVRKSLGKRPLEEFRCGMEKETSKKQYGRCGLNSSDSGTSSGSF